MLKHVPSLIPIYLLTPLAHKQTNGQWVSKGVWAQVHTDDTLFTPLQKCVWGGRFKVGTIVWVKGQLGLYK